jgi:hypothetical protein
MSLLVKPTLSNLIVDVDKDWNARKIENLGAPDSGDDVLRWDKAPFLLSASAIVIANDAPTAVKNAAIQAKQLWGDLVQICDGVDDQVEIQAAIDALPANRGRVQLSEGTFLVSLTVRIKNFLHLLGVGSGTVIKLANGANCNVIENDNITHGNSFFLLSDFKIDGNRANCPGGGYGLYLEKCILSRIENLTVSETHDSPIKIHAGTTLTFINIWAGATDGGKGIWCYEGFNHRFFGITCEHVTAEYGTGIYLNGKSYTAHGIYVEDCYYAFSFSYLSDSFVSGLYQYNITRECFTADYASNSIFAGGDVGSILIQEHTHDCMFVKLKHTALTDSGANNRFFTNHSDLFMDVLAASLTHIYPSTTADTTEHSIDEAHCPDVPRNVSVSVKNVSGGALDITETTCTVTGVDAKGNSITEDITVPATAGMANGATVDAYGSKAFAKVTKIKFSAAQANTEHSVGISDKLGLSNVIYESGDVYKIKKNNTNVAVGTVDVTNGTVDCAAITVGDDFTIYYRSNLNIVG